MKLHLIEDSRRFCVFVNPHKVDLVAPRTGPDGAALVGAAIHVGPEVMHVEEDVQTVGKRMARYWSAARDVAQLHKQHPEPRSAPLEEALGEVLKMAAAEGMKHTGASAPPVAPPAAAAPAVDFAQPVPVAGAVRCRNCQRLAIVGSLCPHCGAQPVNAG